MKLKALFILFLSTCLLVGGLNIATETMAQEHGSASSNATWTAATSDP